jgi:hypothetical protein
MPLSFTHSISSRYAIQNRKVKKMNEILLFVKLNSKTKLKQWRATIPPSKNIKEQ